jgi:hypothetical protein
MLILFQDNRGAVLSLPMAEILTGNVTNIQQVNLQCEINGTVSPLDSLLAVAMLPSSSQTSHSLLLAIGKVSMPQFIKYSFSPASLSHQQGGDDGQLPSTSLVIPLTSQEKQTKKASKEGPASASSLEVTMVGPHESGGLKRPLVALGQEEEEESEQDEEEDGNKKKKRKETSSALTLNGENSLTLEERLRNITTTLTNLEHDPEHLIKSANPLPSPNTTSTTNALLTSDSLVVLIEQSLQSQDDALLEQCLSQSADNIIFETIRRLSSNKIILFLKKLISKFEKKSSRGLTLIRWISVILRSHTSFLLSIHDLSAQLIGLNTILEQRLSTYMKLSSLAGRLDLIMAHLPTTSTATVGSTMAGVGVSSTAVVGGASASDGENAPRKNGQQSSASGGSGRGNKKNQPKQVVYED